MPSGDDWEHMVAGIDAERERKKRMTKEDVQRHLGRRLQPGGQTPSPAAEGRRNEPRPAAAPAPRQSSTFSGIGVGGKHVKAFVGRESSRSPSHRGVTLFMVGMGAVLAVSNQWLVGALTWVRGISGH